MWRNKKDHERMKIQSDIEDCEVDGEGSGKRERRQFKRVEGARAVWTINENR